MRRLFDAARRAPVTALLLLACAAVFVAMLARGGFEADSPEFDEATLLAFGALRSDKVWDGDLWRLLSAGLVHADPLHILFNSWALATLGAPLERLLGPSRTLLLIIGSQLGCTVTHVCFGGMAVLIGASGVACGMLGGLLVALIRRNDPGAVANRRLLVLWALQVLVLSVALPGVSLLGHLGGGLAGAALMVGLDPEAGTTRERLVSLGFACLLIGIGVHLAIREPDRPNWNAAQGFSHYEKHEFAAALPFLRKALNLGAGDYRPDALEAAVGDSLVETGATDAGLAELAIADLDGSAYAAGHLGDLAKDPHASIRHYARSVELDSKDAEYRQALVAEVVSLASQGDLPDDDDLAPLVHIPDGSPFASVRLVKAVAAANAGQTGPLEALRAELPNAAELITAFGADGGNPESAPPLLADLLRKMPGALPAPDSGPANLDPVPDEGT